MLKNSMNIWSLPMSSKSSPFIYHSLEEAAEKGIYSAYFYLGFMYYTGFYVKKDTEKAIDCYIKGASKNNAFCYFELSRLYSEGKEVEKDPRL